MSYNLIGHIYVNYVSLTLSPPICFPLESSNVGNPILINEFHSDMFLI